MTETVERLCSRASDPGQEVPFASSTGWAAPDSYVEVATQPDECDVDAGATPERQVEHHGHDVDGSVDRRLQHARGSDVWRTAPQPSFVMRSHVIRAHRRRVRPTRGVVTAPTRQRAAVTPRTLRAARTRGSVVRSAACGARGLSSGKGGSTRTSPSQEMRRHTTGPKPVAIRGGPRPAQPAPRAEELRGRGLIRGGFCAAEGSCREVTNQARDCLSGRASFEPSWRQRSLVTFGAGRVRQAAETHLAAGLIGPVRGED